MPSGRVIPCNVRNCSHGYIALSYRSKSEDSICSAGKISRLCCVPTQHSGEFCKASIASTIGLLPSIFSIGEKARPPRLVLHRLLIRRNAACSISRVLFFITSNPFRRGLHKDASARPAKDSGFSPLGISLRLDVTKQLTLYGTARFAKICQRPPDVIDKSRL